MSTVIRHTAKMTTRRATLATTLATLALVAGCSSPHQVDYAAWKADLAAVGVTSPDMAKLEKVVRETCDFDTATLAMFVATTLDGGGSTEELRVEFKNVCPDKLPDLDTAVADIQSARTATDLACKTDARSRTQAQADLAEAMGC